MKTYILITLVGIFFLVPAALFLSIYYQLVRASTQTTGEIVSFDRSNFTAFRNILVPIIRFKAQDGSLIEGQPEYSFFHELNGFVRNSNVTVYYQPDNPESSVIACQTEVVINWIVIGVTVCLISWSFLN